MLDEFEAEEKAIEQRAKKRKDALNEKYKNKFITRCKKLWGCKNIKELIAYVENNDIAINSEDIVFDEVNEISEIEQKYFNLMNELSEFSFSKTENGNWRVGRDQLQKLINCIGNFYEQEIKE